MADLKKLKKIELPHTAHAKNLDRMSAMASELFAMLSEKIIDDIVKTMKKDKLAKSENLGKGWTGEVPKIELDIAEKISPVLAKYFMALKYFMLGDFAGKEAKEAAEKLGLKKKIVPGAAFGAYLDAIDTQRDYYEKIMGKKAPDLAKDIVKGSFSIIQNKTDRTVEELLNKFQNRLIDTVTLILENKNIQNTQKVYEEAHETGDLSEAAEQVEDRASVKDLKKELQLTVEKVQKDWDRDSESIINLSSASGTHQAVAEIFGATDDSVKVALVSVRDERCCAKCEELSRNPDGTLILYNLGDFKPSGYNYGRKQKDWALTIPGIHPRCRCSIVYVPPGFSITDDGEVVKRKSK